MDHWVDTNDGAVRNYLGDAVKLVPQKGINICVCAVRDAILKVWPLLKWKSRDTVFQTVLDVSGAPNDKYR